MRIRHRLSKTWAQPQAAQPGGITASPSIHLPVSPHCRAAGRDGFAFQLATARPLLSQADQQVTWGSILAAKPSSSCFEGRCSFLRSRFILSLARG